MKPQPPTNSSKIHYDPLAGTTPEQWAQAIEERENDQQGPPEFLPEGSRRYFEAVLADQTSEAGQRRVAKEALDQDNAKRAGKNKAA